MSNGLVGFVHNVLIGKSQIDLTPLAVAAAIVPAFRPVASFLSSVAATAPTTSPTQIAAQPTATKLLSAGVTPMSNGIPPDYASLGMALTFPPVGVEGGPVPATPLDVPIPAVPTVPSLPSWLQTGLGLFGINLPGVSTAMISATPSPFSTGAAGIAAGLGAGITGAGLKLPAIDSVLPKWMLRAGEYATAAAAIYQLYIRLRALGHSHKVAKRTALRAAGVHVRRRRMRPTNVHALRRAIRRVHSFSRICRKVGGLHVGRHRILGRPQRPRYVRRYRRGDVDPFEVENELDRQDELEDLQYEPDYAYE